jgi:predicted Zn-ribbon and HTH transcriptional regulator
VPGTPLRRLEITLASQGPRKKSRGRSATDREVSVLECAVAAAAEWLVTADRDLLSLGEVEGLAHVARSLRRTAERLRVEPAQCLDCGFVFRRRTRLDRPSACPICRNQHIGPPRFAVQPV